MKMIKNNKQNSLTFIHLGNKGNGEKKITFGKKKVFFKQIGN